MSFLYQTRKFNTKIQHTNSTNSKDELNSLVTTLFKEGNGSSDNLEKILLGRIRKYEHQIITLKRTNGELSAENQALATEVTEKTKEIHNHLNLINNLEEDLTKANIGNERHLSNKSKGKNRSNSFDINDEEMVDLT